MVLPLTDDARLVETYRRRASPTRIMPVPGKDTAKALAAADAALADETAPGTILFLTDGVERAPSRPSQTYTGKNDLMVLGIGTPEGGPVKTGERRVPHRLHGARVQARARRRCI